MTYFYTNVATQGNHVLLRGYENGRAIAHKIRYEPTFYSASQEDTGIFSLEGVPLKPIRLGSILEGRDLLAQYEGLDDPPIYGMQQARYAYINEFFPGDLHTDLSQLFTATIDIETDSAGGFPNIEEADKAITAITCRLGDKYHAFFYRGDFHCDEPDVVLHPCADEVELLYRFLKLWMKRYPDLVTGWNIDFFDIPYLINRYTKIFGLDIAKKFSPWKILRERETFYMGQMRTVWSPIGVAVLDYQRIYRTPKMQIKVRDSYTLDNISTIELKEKKLDYRAEGYKSLDDLYVRNFQRFMEYNIRDVRLVDKLEAKLQLIDLVCTMAYVAHVNYEDALGSVNQWQVISFNYLKDNGIIPRVWGKQHNEKVGLVGAYVKNPQIGMCKWGVSLDLDSLYSHLIMQYNISPETYVGQIRSPQTPDEAAQAVIDILDGALDEYHDGLISDNVVCAGNFACYTRAKKGFIPTLLAKMYEQRKIYKGKMLDAKKHLTTLKEGTEEYAAGERAVARWDNFQKAFKTNLNSAYGVLTNRHYQYYDHINAEAVTTSGQLAVQWIERKINAWMNAKLGTTNIDYVVASDTDSIYLKLEEVVIRAGMIDKPTQEIVDFVDQFVQAEVEPFIVQSFAELGEYVNAFEQKMRMKRESIFDKGIWTGKKHYILNVHDKENVRKTHIAVTGIESVKSSTPGSCRKKLDDVFKCIMTGTESDVIDLVEQFKGEFMKLPFEDVACPRGVKGLEKYSDDARIYGKKTPIHVRGALLYNNLVEERGLSNDRAKIYDGDKIKFCYLIMPNPIHENVIAVPGDAPDMMGLEDYIDRELQFDKCFLDPLKEILSCIGWSPVRSNYLDDYLTDDITYVESHSIDNFGVDNELVLQ